MKSPALALTIKSENQETKYREKQNNQNTIDVVLMKTKHSKEN